MNSDPMNSEPMNELEAHRGESVERQGAPLLAGLGAELGAGRAALVGRRRSRNIGLSTMAVVLLAGGLAFWTLGDDPDALVAGPADPSSSTPTNAADPSALTTPEATTAEGPSPAAGDGTKFEGSVICEDGDPAPGCADPVEPGELADPGGVDEPPPTEGDSWRLLGVHDIGDAPATDVAINQEALDDLWAELGTADEVPSVDFDSEIAVRFGTLFSPFCAHVRLDEVVMDAADATIRPELVLPGEPRVCRASAESRSYFVAIERAALPSTPFEVRAGGESNALAEELSTTVTEEMLSASLDAPEPTSVPDTSIVEPLPPGPGVEVGRTYEFSLYSHCGIEWAQIDGDWWRTTRLDTGTGNPPAGWGNPFHAGQLTLTDDDTAEFSGPNGPIVFRRTDSTQGDPLGCD